MLRTNLGRLAKSKALIKNRYVGVLMVVRAGRRQVRIDVPQALFVSAIAAFCVVYFWNARTASSDIQNMLLIEPAVILALVLCAMILREAVRIEPSGASRPSDLPVRELPGKRVIGSMILLGLYVFSMARIGFDLATYLYILLSLILLGERRILVLTILPLACAAIIVYGLSAVSTIPLPLLWRWGR